MCAMYAMPGKRRFMIEQYSDMVSTLKIDCCGVQLPTTTLLIHHGVLINGYLFAGYFGLKDDAMRQCCKDLNLTEACKVNAMPFFYRGDVWDFYEDIMDWIADKDLTSFRFSHEEELVDIQDILFKFQVRSTIASNIIPRLPSPIVIGNKRYWKIGEVRQILKTLPMILLLSAGRMGFFPETLFKSNYEPVRDLKCKHYKACSEISTHTTDYMTKGDYMNCDRCFIYQDKMGFVDRLNHPAECYIHEPTLVKIGQFMSVNKTLPQKG